MRNIDINEIEIDLYNLDNKYTGSYETITDLFCLAASDYCEIIGNLNLDLLKFIQSIANRQKTELEDFTLLRFNNEVIGLVVCYTSDVIFQKNIVTNLTLKKLATPEKRKLLTRKLKVNSFNFPDTKEKYLYISRFSIVPELQNIGVGRFMLKSVEGYNKENLPIYLHVKKSNTRALEFYMKEGFAINVNTGNYCILRKRIGNNEKTR